MSNGNGNSGTTGNAFAGDGIPAEANDVQLRESDQVSGDKLEQVSGQEKSPEAKTQRKVPVRPTEDQMAAVVKQYVDAAIKDEQVAYDYFHIKKNYPKSLEAIVNYMLSKANIPDMDMETIMGVFMYAPRGVFFNIFDNEGLYVNIVGKDKNWSYYLNDAKTIADYETRTLAEVAGFEAALAQLELKLTKP
jgi:hypothetical protein